MGSGSSVEPGAAAGEAVSPGNQRGTSSVPVSPRTEEALGESPRSVRFKDYGERTFGLNYETFDELKYARAQKLKIIPSRKMDIRELSHRVHQLSAREELMLTASKLASVPVEEDVLLVVVGLQLQIEIASLQGTAVTNCFIDAVEPEGPHHIMTSVEDWTASRAKTRERDWFDGDLNQSDAQACVDDQHTYHVAKQFAEVEHIFTFVSVVILGVFLIENILFMVAFRWRYFKLWFFPLDLFVVLLSLTAEIGQLSHHGHYEVPADAYLAPVTKLGTAASMFYEGMSAWAGLLILARMWRFARIGHAVFLLREAEERGIRSRDY
eukprot:g31553.t1